MPNSIVTLRPLNSVMSTVAGCHSAVFWKRCSLNSPSTRQLKKMPSGGGVTPSGMPSEIPVWKRRSIRSPAAILGSWSWVAARVGGPITVGWRKMASRRWPRLMAGRRISIDLLPVGSDDASPGRRGACQRTSATDAPPDRRDAAMINGTVKVKVRCRIAPSSLPV